EEFKRGQRYANWRTNEDATEPGQGGTLLSSTPYYHEQHGEGLFTHSLFRLGNRLPDWVNRLVPPSVLVVDEKSWINYPYFRTIITIPFFSKLRMEIETIHLQDDGSHPNALGLSPAELALRRVDWMDIGSEPVAKRDYKAELDPLLVRSKLTGRGPLTPGWQKRERPLMCAYKVVRAQAEYWGVQNSAERLLINSLRQAEYWGVQNSAERLLINSLSRSVLSGVQSSAEKLLINSLRQIFLRAHKNCFGLVDYWFAPALSHTLSLPHTLASSPCLPTRSLFPTLLLPLLTLSAPLSSSPCLPLSLPHPVCPSLFSIAITDKNKPQIIAITDKNKPQVPVPKPLPPPEPAAEPVPEPASEPEGRSKRDGLIAGGVEEGREGRRDGMLTRGSESEGGEGEGEGEETEEESEEEDEEWDDEVEFYEAQMQWAAEEELFGEKMLSDLGHPLSLCLEQPPPLCPLCCARTHHQGGQLEGRERSAEAGRAVQECAPAVFCVSCGEFFCHRCFHEFHITPRLQQHATHPIASSQTIPPAAPADAQNGYSPLNQNLPRGSTDTVPTPPTTTSHRIAPSGTSTTTSNTEEDYSIGVGSAGAVASAPSAATSGAAAAAASVAASAARTERRRQKAEAKGLREQAREGEREEREGMMLAAREVRAEERRDERERREEERERRGEERRSKEWRGKGSLLGRDGGRRGSWRMGEGEKGEEGLSEEGGRGAGLWGGGGVERGDGRRASGRWVAGKRSSAALNSRDSQADFQVETQGANPIWEGQAGMQEGSSGRPVRERLREEYEGRPVELSMALVGGILAIYKAAANADANANAASATDAAAAAPSAALHGIPSPTLTSSLSSPSLASLGSGASQPSVSARHSDSALAHIDPPTPLSTSHPPLPSSNISSQQPQRQQQQQQPGTPFERSRAFSWMGPRVFSRSASSPTLSHTHSHTTAAPHSSAASLTSTLSAAATNSPWSSVASLPGSIASSAAAVAGVAPDLPEDDVCAGDSAPGVADVTVTYGENVTVTNGENVTVTDVQVVLDYLASEAGTAHRHELQRFRILSELLADMQPQQLGHSERLAFWINVYNALAMHAYLVYGQPRSHYKRVMFMHKSAYIIAGLPFSILAIEHCILRAASFQPALCSATGGGSAWRYSLALHPRHTSFPFPTVHPLNILLSGGSAASAALQAGGVRGATAWLCTLVTPPSLSPPSTLSTFSSQAGLLPVQRYRRGDVRYSLALDRPEPLVTFALSCGCASAPPVSLASLWPSSLSPPLSNSLPPLPFLHVLFCPGIYTFAHYLPLCYHTLTLIPTTAGSAAADSAEAESTVAEDMKQRRGLRGKTEADVIVIGSGIGGLCCGSLLARYGRDTLVLESHYLPGGAAHGFTRNGFSFDTGPSLFSGLSSRGPQANPLAQVLDALGETVPCAAYDSWMCYLPEGDFLSRIGPSHFIEVLQQRVGEDAVRDWRKLMAVVEPLAGPSMALPPAALRADPAVLLTAGLRYGPSLLRTFGNAGPAAALNASKLMGPFSSLANSVGVKHPFVRNWIDLLSFLLSGQKADATIAAEVVYMFAEWYKPGSVMEYPLGGPEAIIEALIRGMEKHGGQLSLNCHVDSIVVEGGRAVGVKLKSGQVVRARTAVVSNASVWDTMRLLPPGSVPAEYRKEREATPECDSFMHLHLGIKKENLPADLEIHHIVVNDWSVGVDAPQNVVLISIPTVLDASLSPPGTVSLHAYTPGTEPASLWQGLDRRSAEYKKLKEERAEVMWKAVERVLGPGMATSTEDGEADYMRYLDSEQAVMDYDMCDEDSDECDAYDYTDDSSDADSQDGSQGDWDWDATPRRDRTADARQYQGEDDSDEDNDMLDGAADVSAQQAARGRDIQGIPWERLHFTRAKYRAMRLQQYKNYKNLDVPLDAVDKEVKQVSTDAEFFSFAYNTRAVKSTIVHFQLRNLVWATSKHDVYTMHGHTIGHYSALSHRSVDFLDLSGPVVPISHLSLTPLTIPRLLLCLLPIPTPGPPTSTPTPTPPRPPPPLPFPFPFALRQLQRAPWLYHQRATTATLRPGGPRLYGAGGTGGTGGVATGAGGAAGPGRGDGGGGAAAGGNGAGMADDGTWEPVGRVQVSTLCVRNGLVAAGGFNGEMVCKRLDSGAEGGVSYAGRITRDESAITNAVEIFESASGAVRVLTSNNDCLVREFDADSFAIIARHHLPWPINHTSVSPNGKLVVVVGDDPDAFLMDATSGRVVAPLSGHVDYSFASAWHPNGLTFATGNQDTTCRVWDLRCLSRSLATLKGRMGAIRSVRFSSDGRFLAVAEPADFVHVYDVKGEYERSQEIDLFGEIAGVSFSPDSEALFVGVADRTYSSLLEFNRARCCDYIDATRASAGETALIPPTFVRPPFRSAAESRTFRAFERWMRDEGKIQWSEKLVFLLTCPPPPPRNLRHGARARHSRASPSVSPGPSACPPPGPLPVGVFARAPLPLGTSVATIPKSACLTPRTSLLAPYFSASPFFQAEGEAEGEGEGSEEGEGEADEDGEGGEEEGGSGDAGERGCAGAVGKTESEGATKGDRNRAGTSSRASRPPPSPAPRLSPPLSASTQAVPSDLVGMRGEWKRHILPFLLSLPPHLLHLLPPSPTASNDRYTHEQPPLEENLPSPNQQLPGQQMTNRQLPDQLSWDAYLAVKSLISSRAFSIDSWHGHGMVPLADLFNHRTASESVHFTINDGESDPEESGKESDEDGEEVSEERSKSERGKGGDEEKNGARGRGEEEEEEEQSLEKEGEREKASEQLEMIMVREEGPGDEVFNTYGQLSTAALLLRYGFTEPLSFGGAGPKGGEEELPVRLGKGGPWGGEEEQLECICNLQYNPFDLVNVDLNVIIKGLSPDQSQASSRGGRASQGERFAKTGRESSQSHRRGSGTSRAAKIVRDSTYPSTCSSRRLRWAVKLLERAGCPPLESQGERYFEISADGRPQLELLLLLRLAGLGDVAAARVDARVAEREADVDWAGMGAAELAGMVEEWVEGMGEGEGIDRRAGSVGGKEKGQGGSGKCIEGRKRREGEERMRDGEVSARGDEGEVELGSDESSEGRKGRKRRRGGRERRRGGRERRRGGRERRDRGGGEHGSRTECKEEQEMVGVEREEENGDEEEDGAERGEEDGEEGEYEGEEESNEEEVAATRGLLELPTVRALLSTVLHARDRMYGGARITAAKAALDQQMPQGRGGKGRGTRSDARGMVGAAANGTWTVVDELRAAQVMERKESAMGVWGWEREEVERREGRQSEGGEHRREWWRLLHARRLRVAERGVLMRCRAVWLGERCLCGREWRGEEACRL
ncbi:unnamed protein product, partial [Closterium sp. NIES-65]